MGPLPAGNGVQGQVKHRLVNFQVLEVLIACEEASLIEVSMQKQRVYMWGADFLRPKTLS